MSLTRYLMIRAARAATYPLYRRQLRFLRACENPEAVQSALLFSILRRQVATGFGRDHHFAAIRTVADFRRNVSVAPYEQIEPYIDRVAHGETSALFADDRVLMFALTSGTTAARKRIPVTARYLRDFRRGWNLWGIRAFRDHRPRSLPLRPIVQMVGDPAEFRTPAGIPCGNLTGFAAQVQKRIIRRMYAVPPESGRIKDARSRYYLALRQSVGRPCALFTAANPSTLVYLGRTLDAEKVPLLKDLHDGTLSADLDLPGEVRAAVAPRLKANPARARELGALAARTGHLYPKDVWPPETILVGTWTGGSMGPYLRQLPQYYGDPPIRDLGLIASEGRMTIPFANHTPSGVLDIYSHYFEFIPEAEGGAANPTVLTAHELNEGQSYFLVMTTAAGLYRYAISDLVRVTGFVGRTPLVEFLGKGNRFANLTGEKLSEHHVTQAFDAASARTGFRLRAYAMVAIWDEVRSYYALYLEEPDAGDGLPAFLAELDRQLCTGNVEYQSKRESERLGPVRGVVVPEGGWAAWDRERLTRTGGSAEQYKHPCLIADAKAVAGMRVVRRVG